MIHLKTRLVYLTSHFMKNFRPNIIVRTDKNDGSDPERKRQKKQSAIYKKNLKLNQIQILIRILQNTMINLVICLTILRFFLFGPRDPPTICFLIFWPTYTDGYCANAM